MTQEALKLAQMVFNMIAIGDNLDWIKYQAAQQAESLRKALAQPQQEPVAWMTEDGEIYKHECWPEYKARPLVFGDTSPPQRKPLNGVLVPLNVLEAAEESLGSFCSDHGWADEDMKNMDNLSAYIAEHKAAHGIKGEA